jgi:WhiB family redox-sensing transcriptional regulator
MVTGRSGEPTAARPRSEGVTPRVGIDPGARTHSRGWVPAISRQILPRPTTEAWSWLMNARCRGLNTDVFFAPDGERPEAASRRQRQAISCCVGCAVIEECRNYALTYEEPWGVWGGLSESERRRILNSRRRF